MMRVWLGVALLAGSWLWGLDYYYAGNAVVWLLLAALGTLALAEDVARQSDRRASLIAIALAAVAVWGMPWPYRAAPLWLLAGLTVQGIPSPRPWVQRLARGAIVAAVILLAQGVSLEIYAAMTARSHELPAPLADLLAGITRLLGVEVALDGDSLAIRSQRQVHHLGTSWELLLDPALLCFFVGGLVLLAVRACETLSAETRLKAWARAACTLMVVVGAWAAIRAGLMIAVMLQRELYSNIDVPLHIMNHGFSPWLLLALLAVPALLATRLARLLAVPAAAPVGRKKNARKAVPVEAAPEPRRPASAVGLVCLGAVLAMVAIYWEPVGRAKAGRVMFVERHSTWEPSDRGYRTDVFGEDSGYNYSAIYDYGSRFFDMSRLLESEPIDERRLAACDVLVVKVPTASYAPAEVEAVRRFVERGGGLLLIGEHTNFSRSTMYLNEIARHFGFSFRNDLLFGLDSAYDQFYQAPAIPHPAVQHVDAMDFAVSCSIEPGWSLRRAALRSSGLWSLPPDYNMENYFPVPQHYPQMRYGAFVQLWATRFGEGRVAAFTDSTIFSNFSTFEPGKAELFLNMLAWLNHSGGNDNPRGLLLFAAAAAAGGGLWLGRRRWSDLWLPTLAAGLCAAVLAGQAVAAVHRWALPPPAQKRPMVRVVIDRTLSEVPLAKGGFISGGGEGFGLLEQWIPRLGYFTARRSGPEAFSGDLLVVVCPTRSVSPDYRRRLIEYVSQGGKLLVLDSPENVSSTANSLLWPFGLSIYHERPGRGELMIGDGMPALSVPQACGLWGGTPLARIGDRPVAVTVAHGKGTVTAVGFGSLFNDRNMGMAWTVEPDINQRQRYELLFALLRGAVERKSISELWSGTAPTKQDAPAASAKEETSATPDRDLMTPRKKKPAPPR